MTTPATPAGSAEADAPFDAVVLAMGAAAHGPKVCGLTLAERGRRLAQRAGARRVLTVDSADAARDLAAQLTPDRDLVVLRCSDQVVHFPLVDAVRGGGARIAIGADDVYAGALWVPAAMAGEVARALADDPEHGDATIAATWRSTQQATTHVHGEIARHRAVTDDERRAATRLLFRIIHKPQDATLARVLYRPIAYPLTRMFLPTSVTPNAITFMAASISLIGCILVAFPSYQAAVFGSLMQHLANYLDCCDGEVARLRHEGSKRGQWFDTIADEATTVAYTAAVGIHVYQNHDGAWYQPYLGWSIPVAVLGSLTSIYVIYWYLVKVSRTGNSQDYPVKEGGVSWLAELTHRDVISLGVLVLAVLDLNEVSFALLGAGGVVSSVILMREHLQLRRDLRTGRVVPRPA